MSAHESPLPIKTSWRRPCITRVGLDMVFIGNWPQSGRFCSTFYIEERGGGSSRPSRQWASECDQPGASRVRQVCPRYTERGRGAGKASSGCPGDGCDRLPVAGAPPYAAGRRVGMRHFRRCAADGERVAVARRRYVGAHRRVESATQEIEAARHGIEAAECQVTEA